MKWRPVKHSQQNWMIMLGFCTRPLTHLHPDLVLPRSNKLLDCLTSLPICDLPRAVFPYQKFTELSSSYRKVVSGSHLYSDTLLPFCLFSHSQFSHWHPCTDLLGLVWLYIVMSSVWPSILALSTLFSQPSTLPAHLDLKLFLSMTHGFSSLTLQLNVSKQPHAAEHSLRYWILIITNLAHSRKSLYFKW